MITAHSWAVARRPRAEGPDGAILLLSESRSASARRPGGRHFAPEAARTAAHGPSRVCRAPQASRRKPRARNRALKAPEAARLERRERRERRELRAWPCAASTRSASAGAAARPGGGGGGGRPEAPRRKPLAGIAVQRTRTDAHGAWAVDCRSRSLVQRATTWSLKPEAVPSQWLASHGSQDPS